MIKHDVLVVGGGLAGLRAAVGLAERWDVAVISQVHPVRSHSGAAQGGINAALGNAPDGGDDSPERHAFDTIKGSDYLADQAAVLTMCGLAPEVVYEFEHWGAAFSRFPDGRIAQRPFGGTGFSRTCYAADRTGHVLLQTLYEQIGQARHPRLRRARGDPVGRGGRPVPRRDRLRPETRAAGRAWPRSTASWPPAATAASSRTRPTR